MTRKPKLGQGETLSGLSEGGETERAKSMKKVMNINGDSWSTLRITRWVMVGRLGTQVISELRKSNVVMEGRVKGKGRKKG